MTELENNVSQLQEKLSVLKKSFSDVMPKDSAPLTADSEVMIYSTGDEIVKLRAELNLAKGELNKYVVHSAFPTIACIPICKAKTNLYWNPS